MASDTVGGLGTRQPDLAPDDAVGARRAKRKPAADSKPPRRPAKSRLDEWMEVDFKFGGSRIKRKTIALVVLGAPALVPLFFMLPALVTLDSNTFSVSVDDTLGTGAEIALFLCLLVTPLTTITGQRWFVPLRRWYGIVMACTGIGDAVAASITDDFAGGVFGRLAGHAFELMGFMMVMLVIPLLITSNPYSQRKLGKYWKRFQGLTYAIWALLAAHLILLEGFGFQRGANGSGFAGDGDPIFHQRFYQYSACSLFLLILRLPPARRWIAARQREGRNWLVYVVVLPLFALFVFGFIFILNEEIFKGIDSFTEHPSNE
jgi:DMSO/TMAO reductase YedYZ heme-binding membrane subunit